MKTAIKRIAARVIAAGSLSALFLFSSCDNDNTNNSGNTAPTSALKYNDFEPYLDAASDVNSGTAKYADELIEILLTEIISKGHISSPEVSKLRKTALLSIQEYIDKNPSYKTEEIIEAALDGVLNSLDAHSNYFNNEETKKLIENIAGQTKGIGILFHEQNDGYIEIRKVMEDSPGEKIGLKAGDIITHVNDTDLKILSREEKIQKLKEKKYNGSIKLTLKRDGISQPLEFYIKLGPFNVNPVSHKILDNNVAYIQLDSFMGDASRYIENAIQELQSKIGKDNISGYVLDLRFNGGGLVNECQEIADHFLEKGEVFSMRDINGNYAEQKYQNLAFAGDITNGKPITVLINRFSASASEMLAEALQDQGRATIIGRRSYGKGSAQAVLGPIPLIAPQQGAITLTNQLFYSPSGDTVQGRGVIPDIRTDFARSSKVDNLPVLREEDKKNALKNPAGKSLNLNAELIASRTAYNEPISECYKLPSGEVDYELICAAEVITGKHIITKLDKNPKAKTTSAPKPSS